jgi:flagellar basal body P-ring formation protein FlgA
MKTIYRIVGLMLLSSLHLAFGEEIQTPDSLSQAAVDFVGSQLPGDAEYQITASSIDPRLKLPTCEQRLQVFSQTGEVKPGRNTIALRCDGKQSWQIFTAVQVRAMKPVLVLNAALRRGDVIHLAQINTELRDTGQLTAGYLTDIQQIVGKQASRNLSPNTVLTRQMYDEPTVIRRGQQVSIMSGNPEIQISAPGVALSDGSAGTIINVKNSSSQRVVQAKILNEQQVVVNR